MNKKGSLPPWMSVKAGRKAQNAKSQRKEREHAKRTGGTTRAGSGSSWRAPEDVRGPVGDDGEGFLDQHKGTDAHSFSLDAREFTKTHDNALREGRTGRWIIEFYQHGLTLEVTVHDA